MQTTDRRPRPQYQVKFRTAVGNIIRRNVAGKRQPHAIINDFFGYRIFNKTMDRWEAV